MLNRGHIFLQIVDLLIDTQKIWRKLLRMFNVMNKAILVFRPRLHKVWVCMPWLETT